MNREHLSAEMALVELKCHFQLLAPSLPFSKRLKHTARPRARRRARLDCEKGIGLNLHPTQIKHTAKSLIRSDETLMNPVGKLSNQNNPDWMNGEQNLLKLLLLTKI